MSHDTGHGHSTENKTIISFKNSFWLVIILVGLFVAALNFINAESGHEEHATEEHHGAGETHHPHGQEAKEAEVTEHNTEASKPEEAAPAADSAAHH
jgi:hypothetical protein